MAYLPPDQIPPGTSPATRAAIIDMIRSSSQIVSVAGETERNQVLAAWEDATGAPVGPLNPCWVDRADTGALERNRGNGWESYSPDVDSGSRTLTPGQGWGASSSWVRRVGDTVTIKVAQVRGTRASGDAWVTLGAGFRPPAVLWVNLVSSTYEACAATVATSGLINLYWPTAVGSSHEIRGTITFVTTEGPPA